MFGEIAFDGGLQVDDGMEAAAPAALAGECGKECLDRVQPRSGRGREVEGPAWMSGEPVAHPKPLTSRPHIIPPLPNLSGSSNGDLSVVPAFFD
jgi:hypothetical protein